MGSKGSKCICVCEGAGLRGVSVYVCVRGRG